MATEHMKAAPSRAILASALAAVAFAVATWHPPVAAQAAMATQTSVEGGVTLKATPRTLTGPEWEFAIVLDTHSEELSDDLQKTSVLAVGGRELQPLQWQGPGAGGHHREGVLRFPAGDAGPMELRIQRNGETAPRVFRWDGATPK